jgi:hypothetical protein
MMRNRDNHWNVVFNQITSLIAREGYLYLYHQGQDLMIETEMVPETSVIFNQFAKLVAREEFIMLGGL